MDLRPLEITSSVALEGCSSSVRGRSGRPLRWYPLRSLHPSGLSFYETFSVLLLCAGFLVLDSCVCRSQLSGTVELFPHSLLKKPGFASPRSHSQMGRWL